ncbi:MAG: HAD-IA family hydrolase [Planctomycetota bacterium]|nr:HAD-IA family hydrolase [Planctomycetota bacterium]
MPPSPAIRVVFFDVGGTLLRVDPSVGDVYARAAREHGWEVDPSLLNARFRDAWKRNTARSAGRGHRTSDETLRSEWSTVVRDTFGASLSSADLGALFEDLYEKFVGASAWRIASGARETLDALRARGLRLGVLSNWDSRLPRTLEQLGLAGLFDVHAVSYEVGFEKPHPRIFEAALERAGAPPENILHVGDSLESDIRPARRLGMKTLWMATAEERAAQPKAGPGARSFDEVPAERWEALLQA